ncbi:unnamed protein product [Phaeothamnion confervicola]
MPPFHASERQGTVLGAVVNLVSTIIGGGMLSLPFALERSGLILGLLLLLLTAIASDYSVYTLVSCSRRSGARTYEAVAEAAFGPRARQFAMALIVTVTYVPLIAYSILLRDLMAPVAEEYVFHRPLGRVHCNILAAAALATVAPACFLRSLHSLRLLSLLSVLSILLLAAAVLVRSVQCASGQAANWAGVNLAPHGGVSGALQGLPIFVCAFVCHFNVLPVHGELARPTRRRLHRMVHWTMAVVTVFYGVVSVSGYVYGVCTGHVGDNILNSFPDDDVFVNLGRVGLIMTILVSFPLMVVPCRDTILRVLLPAGGASGNSSENGGCRHCNGNGGGGGGGGSRGSPRGPTMLPATPPRAEAELVEPLLAGSASVCADNTGSIQAAALHGYCGWASEAPSWARAAMTTTILVSQFAIAASLTKVADVWGLLGGSANVVVAFVGPSAAYIRIRQYQRPQKRDAVSHRKRLAWVLLIAATVSAIVCTANNIVIMVTR